MAVAIEPIQLNEPLLAWYAPRRRTFPWRRSHPDPYHVLVSEVMLQQTQVARVVPAFVAFIERFPTVASLAAAPRAAILRRWEGLGYNRRAVALSEAARMLIREHDGEVPDDLVALRRLPGVGPYTANAIASLAFGRAVAALDVNVARVVARVRLGREAHDGPIAEVEEAAAGWIDREAPGAWNQALMDLGRELCRPVPRCGGCPLAGGCGFLRAGARPTRRPRSQGPFEGSDRQVRGAVVEELRHRSSATIGTLALVTGHDEDRIASAVTALDREGLVRAGPAALRGRASGRVRLAG
ncbi:MAG: A/G-specific adenine glycosylase [Actinomycetota bacterium]